ncbi:MAG: hypothetical protein ACLRXC_06545 [[Clostridium] leptum]
MKIYNIIGGVNGAGKSSLTGSLKYQRRLGPIIDVDKILAQMGGDPLTGGKAAVAVRECMKKGQLARRNALPGTAPNARQRAKEAVLYPPFYVNDTVQEPKHIKTAWKRVGMIFG